RSRPAVRVERTPEWGVRHGRGAEVEGRGSQGTGGWTADRRRRASAPDWRRGRAAGQHHRDSGHRHAGLLRPHVLRRRTRRVVQRWQHQPGRERILNVRGAVGSEAMRRTTPPRPLDIALLFPELLLYSTTATRLHPRPGEPTADDSSVGGPLYWPAAEPWPV